MIKALQLANDQGQKTFTITKNNYQDIIPKLELASAAISDIEAAAKAGYTVTTHERRISVNGYTGEGYAILDDRGVGAWLINGGYYGGLYSNASYKWTLQTLRITGTVDPTNMESVFRNLVGNSLVLLSVTYPEDVEIKPFAGFGAENIVVANIKVGISDLLGHFTTGVMAVASLHPKFGIITEYLIINYYFGHSSPVNLRDVFDNVLYLD